MRERKQRCEAHLCGCRLPHRLDPCARGEMRITVWRAAKTHQQRRHGPANLSRHRSARDHVHRAARSVRRARVEAHAGQQQHWQQGAVTHPSCFSNAVASSAHAESSIWRWASACVVDTHTRQRTAARAHACAPHTSSSAADRTCRCADDGCDYQAPSHQHAPRPRIAAQPGTSPPMPSLTCGRGQCGEFVRFRRQRRKRNGQGAAVASGGSGGGACAPDKGCRATLAAPSRGPARAGPATWPGTAPSMRKTAADVTSVHRRTHMVRARAAQHPVWPDDSFHLRSASGRRERRRAEGRARAVRRTCSSPCCSAPRAQPPPARRGASEASRTPPARSAWRVRTARQTSPTHADGKRARQRAALT
jgi:hypothetical protein